MRGTKLINNPLETLDCDIGWHFSQNVYSPTSILIRSIKAGGGSGNIPKIIEIKEISENDYREIKSEK